MLYYALKFLHQAGEEFAFINFDNNEFLTLESYDTNISLQQIQSLIQNRIIRISINEVTDFKNKINGLYELNRQYENFTISILTRVFRRKNWSRLSLKSPQIL